MKLDTDDDFSFSIFLYTYLSHRKKNSCLITTNFLNEQHCSVVQNMFLVTFFRMFSFSVYKIMARQKLSLVLHFSSAILLVSVLLPCYSIRKIALFKDFSAQFRFYFLLNCLVSVLLSWKYYF